MVINWSFRISSDVLSVENSELVPFLCILLQVVRVRKSRKNIVVSWGFQKFLCKLLRQLWVLWSRWLIWLRLLSRWWRLILFNRLLWWSLNWRFGVSLWSGIHTYWALCSVDWRGLFALHVVVWGLFSWNVNLFLSIGARLNFIICESSVSNRRLRFDRNLTFLNWLLWRHLSHHKIILLFFWLSRCSCSNCIRLFVLLEIKVSRLSPVFLSSRLNWIWSWNILILKQIWLRPLIRHGCLTLLLW